MRLTQGGQLCCLLLAVVAVVAPALPPGTPIVAPGANLLGTLASPERGLYYGTPSDGSYAGLGAFLGQINRTDIWSAMAPGAIKLMYSRFQHFEPDDDSGYSFFPWSQFVTYNAAQVAAGQPSLFITAPYKGVEYQVYDAYHLAVNSSGQPTGPAGQWEALVNFTDPRFITWWHDHYVVPIVFRQNLPNQWLALDNCTFRYGEYGIVDNTNHWHDGVTWDSRFPQNGPRFEQMVAQFFTEVHQRYPGLHLTCNEGTLDDYSGYQSIYGNLDGLQVENENAFYAGGAASLRAAMWQRIVDDNWMATAGKTNLYKWMGLTNDATLPAQLQRAYLHYLMVWGPHTFFDPQFNVPEVPPADYAAIAQALGQPTAPLAVTPAGGKTASSGYDLYSRVTAGGIAYLNWTGITATVTLPPGYVDPSSTLPITSLVIPDLQAAYALVAPAAPTATATATATSTSTDTASPTATPTPTATATNTSTDTATDTPTPTNTPVPRVIDGLACMVQLAPFGPLVQGTCTGAFVPS